MMRSRSRMAALAMAASLGIGPATLAGDAPAVENKVHLILQISGLGPEGAKIEIKPGHKGCDFEPIIKPIKKGKVPAGSIIKLDMDIDAQSTSADRDCSFAITVKEPGQPPKTYHRGLRLAIEEVGKPVPSKVFKCYLSSPSIAARDGDPPKRK